MSHQETTVAIEDRTARAVDAREVSRRAVLGAGMAGAFLATGLMPSPSRAATAGMCDGRLLTVVTPPYVQRSIHETWGKPAFKEQGDTIIKGAEPFRIAPHTTAAPTPLSTIQMTRKDAMAAEDEVALRDEMVAAFLARMTFTACTSSVFRPNSGVGASTITLYRDAKKRSPSSTIQIPGASIKEIRKSIEQMKTDHSRCADIEVQVTYPHLYLARALHLDDRVLQAQNDPVNWTCRLINCVGAFASQAVLAVKNTLNAPRPQDIASAPYPLIDVPPYTAFPAGHATFLAALHVVLRDVTGANGADAETFKKLSDWIAENRELAGLHTRVDTASGQAFGTKLGHAMLRWVDDLDDPDWRIVYASAKEEWRKT